MPPALPPPGIVAPLPVVYPASGFAEKLNEFRRAQDRVALRANARLARAAQAHAEWLRARNLLSHTGRNGSTVQQRAQAQGCSFGSIAENLAVGATSNAQAIRLWANSPPHRANMLARSHRIFGLGRAGGVWVLVLADRC